MGAATITRRAEVKGSYDTNIFLTSATPFTSGIATFTHDLGFTVESSRAKAEASYRILLIQYDRFPGVNNAVNQEAGAGFHYDAGPGTLLGATDAFKATTDPTSSELVERTRRNQNDVTVTAETGLGPTLFAGVDATHELHYYLASYLAEVLNRRQVGGTPRLGIKLTEKTRVYAEGEYVKTTYDRAGGAVKDNTTTRGHVVASGEFTPRIKGKVGAGVTMKRYDTSVTKLTNSDSLPSWDAQVTYEAPAAFTFVLAATRAPQEGVYNRFNITTATTLAVSHPLGKKLMGSAFGMLVGDAYPDLAAGASSTVKRADRTVQAGATLAYAALPWANLTGQFLQRTRDSNLDVFDYTDQVVAVSVDAAY